MRTATNAAHANINLPVCLTNSVTNGMTAFTNLTARLVRELVRLPIRHPLSGSLRSAKLRSFLPRSSKPPDWIKAFPAARSFWLETAPFTGQLRKVPAKEARRVVRVEGSGGK